MDQPGANGRESRQVEEAGLVRKGVSDHMSIQKSRGCQRMSESLDLYFGELGWLCLQQLLRHCLSVGDVRREGSMHLSAQCREEETELSGDSKNCEKFMPEIFQLIITRYPLGTFIHPFSNKNNNLGLLSSPLTPGDRLFITHIMHHLQPHIAPSILSCDFGTLAQQCHALVKAGADSLHIDIMDGHFVPNLTIGPPILRCLRKHLPVPIYFDCHLMVQRPEDYIDSLAEAEVNSFTFHYEATYSNLESICKKLKEKKMRVGVSLKPKTPVNKEVQEAIGWGWIDMILVMSVEPGFGGQKFMEDTMEKVRQLRSMFPMLDIQVDGGVTVENVRVVGESGANWIVSGTGICGSQDPKGVIQKMKEIVGECLK